MNPNAIVGNMMNQGQLMGDGMARQAIEAENNAGAGGGRGRRAIGQAEESKGGMVARGRGAGGASQALVPTAGGGGMPSLLDLFNTPHGFGGGSSSSAGVSGVTRGMRRLQM